MSFCRTCRTLAVVSFLLLVVDRAQGVEIDDEIRAVLKEKGLVEGYCRERREIVAVGISASEKEPELGAHVVACARILTYLKGATLNSMRQAESGSVPEERISLVVKRLTSGFLTGAREVVRVTTTDKSGRTTVALALQWTFKQELCAVESLSVPLKFEQSLAQKISSYKHLPLLSGPQVWISDDGIAWLLGFGVVELKSSNASTLNSSRRLAEVRARRALQSHLNQYEVSVDVLDKRYSEQGVRTARSTEQFVKNMGVLKGRQGVSNIYEEFLVEGERKYAVCICCLSGSDSSE